MIDLKKAVIVNHDSATCYPCISRVGVAYYDSSICQLYVLEVWEDGSDDFPLMDLGMHMNILKFKHATVFFFKQLLVSFKIQFVSLILQSFTLVYVSIARINKHCYPNYPNIVKVCFCIPMFLCISHILFESNCSVKYQAKPRIIYASTKTEESFISALERSGL